MGSDPPRNHSLYGFLHDSSCPAYCADQLVTDEKNQYSVASVDRCGESSTTTVFLPCHFQLRCLPLATQLGMLCSEVGINTLRHGKKDTLPISIKYMASDCIKTVNLSDLTERDWLELAYLVLLQRKIDPVGLSYWSEKIANSSFKYKVLLDSIIASPEYIMHYKEPFSTVLHRARQAWVRTLPLFESILDIGGSSPNIEMGAMIELGYLHRPKKITILDLPPEKQYWGKPKYNQEPQYNYSWGIVEYIHGTAESIHSIECLADRRFECVFMGQTIEHINQESIDDLLTWISAHLSPRGRFVFDTPNRRITKIQSPNKLIDPDHKYEYDPIEMKKILERNGFDVSDQWGLLDMPQTYKNGIFNPLEVYETEPLNRHPETSYCFAFDCQKR
jgi:2-polyprenyl-3-methyl-5-hydroxy-6-metoxy-1,4-benzoquinol methylase